MTVRTAKGKEFECDSITLIPSPPRLYLHIVNVSMEDATVFYEDGQLPIDGYPIFNKVQCVVSEGAARLKVSLKT